MLRRLNVRMRLVAVLMVPFVLLLAVAGPEVLQRRDTARDADRAAVLTGASGDLTVVVEALQTERTLTAAIRAGAGDDIRAVLADQRAVTDAAVDSARAALGRIVRIAPVLGTEVAQGSEQLDGLTDIRQASDLAESIVPWFDPFGPLVSTLLDLHEVVGATIESAGVRDALTEVALLARSKEAAAAQAAQLAATAVWGELRGDQIGILSGLRTDEQAYRTAHLAATPAELQVERRQAVNAGPSITAGRAVDTVIRDDAAAELRGLGSWLATSTARQDVLRAVEVERTSLALDEALAAGADARRAASVYVVLAGAGVLLALALALAAARSITKPLRRLTEAADHLAEERLPKLVDALRHPGEDDERFLATTIQPIEVRSDDELGHLARAFNTVQAVAVDVAAEQADLLRKGISDLYVNLARRNQSLLERQIRLLDQVEHEDQDPELLEHLYELDHLATRMRRNAESLLVLAGAEPDRRRSRPAPAVDVIRAAVSEVEQYGRIELGSITDAVLAGAAVSDVAHIVAELLENATRFSPPDTTVRVDGRRSGSGYQIVIADQGVGLRGPQLDELNQLLREPPVTGLALGRALGCLVAARLAARHDIGVRLQPADGQGLVATVTLPRRLLAEDRGPDAGAAPSAGVPVAAPVPEDDAWLYEWGEAAGPITIGTVPVPELPRPPATLREAVPSPEVIEAGLDAILDEARPATLVEAPVHTQAVDDGPGRVTASGLPRRVPGASGGVESAPEVEPAARRSPEEIRSMLSRYRSGLQAGREDTTQAIEE